MFCTLMYTRSVTNSGNASFFFPLSDNSVEDKSSFDECFSLQDAKYKNIDENG